MKRASYEDAGNMYEHGISIDDISQALSLTKGTIALHINKFQSLKNIKNLDLKKIEKEYTDYASIENIAIKYNVSVGIVVKFLLDNGLIFKTRQRLDNEVIEILANNHCLQEIAVFANSNTTTVNKILSELNLTAQKYLRYKFDENYFSTINTNAKAYWLGYLYADGWISSTDNRIGIELSIKDKVVLEKFKNDIKYEGPINQRMRITNFGKFEQCSIKFSSFKTKNDLIALGCGPQKTEIIQPPLINSKYFRSFIRGFIDGDGYISSSTAKKNRIGIYAQKSMVDWIKSVIPENTGSISLNRTIYHLEYASQATLRVIEWLYEDRIDYGNTRKYNDAMRILGEV